MLYRSRLEALYRDQLSGLRHNNMLSRIYKFLPLVLIPLAAFCLVKICYMGLEHLMTQHIAEIVADKRSEEKTAGITKTKTDRKQYDHKIILTRNLFGSLAGSVVSKKEPIEDFNANLKLTELDIVLMGTIQGSDETNRAIIMDKKSHKQELYWVGDAIQGANIKDIQRGKVILAYNGRFEVLDMSEAAKMRTTLSPANIKPQQGLKKRRIRKRSATVPGGMNIERRRQFGAQNLRQKSPATTSRRLVRPKVIRPSRRIVPRDN